MLRALAGCPGTGESAREQLQVDGPMPTATKLLSGILMAVLGWWVANLIVPHLPEETRIGLFREITAFLGLVVGWNFLGKRAGVGYAQTFGFGIGASAFLVFWMLIVFSGVEMVRRSLRKSYGDPFEALQGMLQIAIDYFVYLSPNEVWVTLVAGGAVIGLIAEWAARRWP